jgi:diguanylate cyclase (GGDEF)-like protein/PAS domain S-box-containing protein
MIKPMRHIMLHTKLLKGKPLTAFAARLKRACSVLTSRDNESPYKLIVDQISDGILVVDPRTQRIDYCNSALSRHLGYSLEEAQQLTLCDIFTDKSLSKDELTTKLIRASKSSAVMVVQQRHKDGALLNCELRCSALRMGGREVLLYVAHDVSVRQKVEQQLLDNQQRLDQMAHHDQLTGLPNRHFLSSFLPRAIAEAKAAASTLGVIFLDLDHFKHINDTRGHETGDLLLREVAQRLQACVRDSDVVIRMGGDEFVVVLRNVPSLAEVIASAARIVDTLKKPIMVGQHPLQTSGSVGVSLFPRDGADVGELLKHADTAMYQAKERGRNNVQMFSPLMNKKLNHRVAMEEALREAIRLKQLDVHYQPVVDLRSRKIVGLEALLRWRHPTHGMIPPDRFIPVAEETGQIVPLGNFVLHRAFQAMESWRKAGIALVPMSVNVSPQQLRRGGLHSIISALLNSHRIPGEMLQLEMTERVMFDNSQVSLGEKSDHTISRLRDLGVRIAIDDFGTGYSRTWRVDALKIDRSFIRDLVTDSSDLAIVHAIVAMARHLNIQVIAEGIESYQQIDILLKLDCKLAQGFLFAKPMPAAECVKWLAHKEPARADEDMLVLTA